jgi:signal transduction histidine kinase
MVRLAIAPDQLQLLIEDDGRGFEADQVPTDRYGLIGMNERIKLLGGTLDLASCPGEGTSLEISIPLERVK